MHIRVVQHAGADAVLTPRAFKHIDVDAALTAAPKGFVVSQFGERNGHVTQLCVHAHHRRTAGKTEYFGLRPACPGKGERHVLDALRHAEAAEAGWTMSPEVVT